MNIKQVAQSLGCSVSTARNYCARGKLRAERIEAGPLAYWEVAPEAIEEFLQQPADPRGRKRGSKRK